MDSRVDEFLSRQHQLKPQSKRRYRVAVKLFNRGLRELEINPATFEEAFLDEEAVHSVLTWMAGRLADETWNGYVVKLKRLSRWLADEDDEVTPRVWRRVKAKSVDTEAKLKHKILTEEEVMKLIEKAEHPRDKCLIGTTWEAGFRVGEALALQIRDCQRDDSQQCYRMTVSGKTGTRSEKIRLTAPLLQSWLYHHPLRHNPEAWLYPKSKNGAYGGRFAEHIKERMTNRLIKR